MAGRNAGARGTDDTDMAAFINAARKCNKNKNQKGQRGIYLGQ